MAAATQSRYVLYVRKQLESNLLRSHLVCSLVLVVDSAEVGHDDGYGQRDHQHTAERADGTEDLPRNGVRNHVTVPAGRTVTLSLNKET